MLRAQTDTQEGNTPVCPMLMKYLLKNKKNIITNMPIASEYPKPPRVLRPATKTPMATSIKVLNGDA